jgi:serine protease Do
MKLKSIPLLLLLPALMLVGCGKDMSAEVVYSRFNPATALITTGAGHGTGIIIDEGNYVLTAYHVVEGHSRITIKHPSMGGAQYATVLSYDILSDIALLKPNQPILIDNYPEISTSEPIVGSTVTVIGYPIDPMPPSTLTRGVISSTVSDQNGIKYIKLDAAVNPGNSGGPVFSERGNIIGLIVSKRMESEGEAWAVSSLTLSELIPQLKSTLRLPGRYY